MANILDIKNKKYDDLLYELLDENERLLDQLLASQIMIETQEKESRNQIQRQKAAMNSVIADVKQYLAAFMRQNAEKQLRSDLLSKSNKYKLSFNKPSFLKSLKKNSGKKFVSQSAEIHKALKINASAEMLATIIDKAGLSENQVATAYTEVAKLTKNPDVKARLAFWAWSLDPIPFRLKWLAFRFHDINDNVSASICLDMLPEDTVMTSSEKKAAEAIRKAVNDQYEAGASQQLIELVKEKEITAVCFDTNKSIDSGMYAELVKAYKNSINMFRKSLQVHN